MEVTVGFHSADGIPLSGTLYIKDGATNRVPGIVLTHGFAGARYPKLAEYLASLGYGVLTFDFRGYGLSGGERGWVIPHEQVIDLRSAITWLSCRPEIEQDRIGVIGSSLGGSVAIMAAAEDQRIKVCVSTCALGRGDSIFRMRHGSEAAYSAFMKSIEEKRRRKERVHRWDIVYIPEDLRKNLPAGIPMEFFPETIDGFLAINAMESVSRIAPRPLFILHAKDDRVVSYEDSVALAARAGGNCKLHLVETGDHYILRLPFIGEMIGEWLMQHLPADSRTTTSSNVATLSK
jgi:uncharacterized protein